MTLADRLRQALALEHAAELIAHDGPVVDLSEQTTAAAVLIPITNRPEPGVILTRRPDTMRKHPGQVAFPGGRIDPDDADVFAAALREAEEEIALPPGLVDIIGPVDPYPYCHWLCDYPDHGGNTC
jgi:8-oxo-dGTP pyrophosphatase MutT (NUDIX family)